MVWGLGALTGSFNQRASSHTRMPPSSIDAGASTCAVRAGMYRRQDAGLHCELGEGTRLDPLRPGRC